MVKLLKETPMKAMKKFDKRKVVEITDTRFFLYKEHLYKELEAEKGSKNKEFLRNLSLIHI